MHLRLIALLPLALMVAEAQTGGPPSRPMPGPGLPLPGRKGKNKDAEQVPLDSLKGVLRSLTKDEMMVEADDKRVFTIARTDKTKFLEKDEPIKVEAVLLGDRVMVDASKDDHGRWTAVEVRVTKRGTPEEHARARAAIPSVDGVEPGKNEEKGTAAEPRPDRPSTEMAPPAPKEISEDERPKLGRGKAAPRKKSANGETEPDEPIVAKVEKPAAASSGNPAEDRRTALSDDPRDYRPKDDAPPSAEAGARDELIEKARDVAQNFVETLPAYSVKQFTTRFQSDNPRVNWQPIDNVSTDVVYENGKENYKNILVNGKPPKGKMEDSGSWSTGEFASVLRDIFSPSTAADFRPSGIATIVNRSSKSYKFVVDQENSHWKISSPGEFYFPAYKGTIWIDRETARVLRIEMQTTKMPKAFPFDTVESTLDYDFIRLGAAKAYLLPVHAENLICVRGTSTCSKNIIDFRNYRKFGAESTIIFK